MNGAKRRGDIFMRSARINRKIDDGTVTRQDLDELSDLALELRNVEVDECAECAKLDRATLEQVATTMATNVDTPAKAVTRLVDGYMIRFHRRAHMKPEQW